MISANLRNVLTQQPLGLVFDIDGTLSPIAPTPDEAQLYPGVAALLEQVKAYAQVAIMTGRAITDGAPIVNVEGLTYIGTHGLEWCDGLPSSHPIQLMPEALPYVKPGKYLLDLAEQELAAVPGVIIQRKNVGGSIHYRLSPDPQRARESILAALEQPAHQAGMRLSEGKKIVEILSPLTIDKGKALRRFVEHFKLRGVFFAGDDRTDLDAVLETIKLRQDGLTSFSVVVQHPDTLPTLLEHADSVVQGVAEMADLLGEITAQLVQLHMP